MNDPQTPISDHELGQLIIDGIAGADMVTVDDVVFEWKPNSQEQLGAMVRHLTRLHPPVPLDQMPAIDEA